jgi:hypothetical protein
MGRIVVDQRPDDFAFLNVVPAAMPARWEADMPADGGDDDEFEPPR